MADPMADGPSIYAAERHVERLVDCYFYHTMALPGYGVVEGEWDFRGGERAYLGGADFSGKRVLEVGTASGYWCRYMEEQGAEVVSYDLSKDQRWDVVPYARGDAAAYIEDREQHIDRLNNSWWLMHRVCNLNARVVYGSVYEIPEEIGTVDVATFGVMLPHVRDPFLALQKGLRLTREKVIVVGIPNRKLSRRWC